MIRFFLFDLSNIIDELKSITYSFRWGHTPEEDALEFGHTEIAALLRKKTEEIRLEEEKAKEEEEKKRLEDMIKEEDEPGEPNENKEE